MSPEKLRELERAFQESGSEEAELAWLRERARAGEKLDWKSYSRLHELDVEAAAGYLRWRIETGDLSQERLALAASCCDSAARLLVGEEPQSPAVRVLIALAAALDTRLEALLDSEESALAVAIASAAIAPAPSHQVTGLLSIALQLEKGPEQCYGSDAQAWHDFRQSVKGVEDQAARWLLG
ncbi:MAG: hypothetical protein JKY65_27945 [Planctomycetes bacterium]|nr:hypothetical protein [Planctomycetota bacterium]